MSPVPAADLEHILDHTRALWEPARGKNFFVTGGTGFFGRWIVESFAFINERLDLGATMTVLTRDPDRALAAAPGLSGHPAVQFVRGDVRRLHPEEILGQLHASHSGEFSFIIHAATESGSTLGQDDPLAMFDTIVSGTRGALEFALGAGATRFLFTSSGAVYGPQPSEIAHLPESFLGGPDCTRPASAYGEGKRAAELLCGCYHAQYPALEPIIARCFAFVGPYLPIDAHFAIGNFIRDAMGGGPIRIGGDGTPYRSYLYAADLAIWLWTLLFRGRPVFPYNVGSEEDVTILELASTVSECFVKPIDVELARQPLPGVLPSRYVPATGLAQAELGLAGLIPLKDAIIRTAAWHCSTNPSLITPRKDSR